MKTPLRILKSMVEDRPGGRPDLSLRDIARRKSILEAATTLFAQAGFHTMTLSDLAAAISVSRPAIRKFFPDLDHLLGTILESHLRSIVTALNTVHVQDPNAAALARAAYLSATRTSIGAPTEAQIVTTRFRHLLPPDEEARLTSLQAIILSAIGGRFPEDTLSFLDNPRFTLPQIEALVATLESLPEPVWADIIPPALPEPAPRPYFLPEGNTLMTAERLGFPRNAHGAEGARPQARAGP